MQVSKADMDAMHSSCARLSFLEDVGKQEWASDLFTWARHFVKFIKAHHKSLAIFRAKSKLELKQSCATICGSFVVWQFGGDGLCQLLA